MDRATELILFLRWPYISLKNQTKLYGEAHQNPVQQCFYINNKKLQQDLMPFFQVKPQNRVLVLTKCKKSHDFEEK